MGWCLKGMYKMGWVIWRGTVGVHDECNHGWSILKHLILKRLYKSNKIHPPSLWSLAYDFV